MLRPCYCTHLKSEHSYRKWFDNQLSGGCGKCLCMDYFPMENLDYLEWEYDRKVDKNKKTVKV